MRVPQLLPHVLLLAAPAAVSSAALGAPVAPSACAPAPQRADSQQPEESPDEEFWSPRTPREQELAARYGDWNVAVVGDQLVTRTEVREFLRDPSFEDPGLELPADTDPLRLQEIRLLAAVEQTIRQELKIQGGLNQGYDPELVQRAVQAAFDNQLAVRGGAVKLGQWLSGIGFDATALRELLKKRLLAQFWMDAVTGRSTGAAGRIYVDSYVRPGALQARYDLLMESPDPALGELIGRRAAELSLRRLVISSEKEGSEKRASDLAGATREFLLTGGGSFDELVEEYAPENQKGEASRLPVREAEATRIFQKIHPGPVMPDFLEAAVPGKVSPVIRFDAGGGAIFFIIYQLESRTEAAEALPFDDLKMQAQLREAISTETRELRIERGLSALARTTHVLPVEARRALITGRRLR